MSLLDTNSDELIAAAEQAPAPIQRKEPAKRFSTWSMLGAAPKGVAAGAAEGTGSTADILGAFGQALATTGGSGKGMFATPTPEERKQTNEATDKLLKEGIDYNSEAGRLFRNVSADYTPDAQTAHVAESAVFNLFRVGSKALTSAATMGNIPGAVVAGLEEGFTQSDQLGQQGVDLATRSKVGAVTALTNAVGFALPVAGATWKSTAALAVAGGPASFIAQNAATREILQAADYSKLADQYDPLDPVGLALSTLLPLGFGAFAMRRAKVKAKGPMPDGTPPPDVVPPKADHPPADLVDAARVNLVREHMDATNPKPGDLEAADAHSKAYKQAMEQQAAGERVSVADIAPLGDVAQASKVLDEVAVLQAERANLLGDASALAERGAIRKAREELKALERNAPPSTEADIKDLAKIIQGREGVSYKTALTQAKKQTADAVTDFEATQARITQAIELNAVAQKATQRIGELDARIADLEKQAGAISPMAAFKRKIDAELGPNSEIGIAARKAMADRTPEPAMPAPKQEPKPAPALADTAQAATKTVAEASTFNPAALATQASDLLAGGKTAGQVIGELEAGGTKVTPELQNMLVGASEFGGRINDLVDQVNALKAQRGPSAQPFDLIAQAVENLRSGTKVDAPKPINPLEARIADMEVRNPTALDAAMHAGFDDQGKPTSTMTARDYLDMIKKEAAQDAADADLIEVAANCFLSGGM